MTTTISDLLHLVAVAPPSSVLYTGNYDPVLVGFSIIVAIFASYAALLVSQHISNVKSVAIKNTWLAGGALCLGLGIWAMHFIGMLAFSLPCSSNYNATLTLLSTFPSILTSAIALKIISRHKLSGTRLAAGGLLLGVGIAAMHYSGMAAMRLNGMILYDVKLLFLSVFVAVVLATLALWINFRLQSQRTPKSPWVTIAGAFVLGLAVSGMHYTAMASAYFVRDGDSTLLDHGMSPTFLAAILMAASGLIIVMTIIAAYVEKTNLLSLERSYKLVSLLLVGWCTIAWLSSDYYYKHISNEFYQRELQVAKEQMDDIAHDIYENTKILKGVAQVVAHDTQTLHAMRRFGVKIKASTLPYEVRKQRWIRDPEFAGLNEDLFNVAKNLDADLIYVLNAAGDCFASNNAGTGATIGSNYADRSYFAQVQAGNPGHQYAMGRTTNIPGLFYAYPVFDTGHFLGTAVVKRDIAKLSDWTNQANAFVSDLNGVIVIARDKQLEFHTLPGATKLSPENIMLQYKRDLLGPVSIAPWRDSHFPAAVRIGDAEMPIILASKTLPEDGLTIYTLRPLDELVRLGTERYWLFALLTAAGSMLIIAASSIVIYWRESRRTTAELRVAATAFESQQGMMITDHNNRILQVNRAFTEITGYSSEEVIGRNPRMLNSKRQDQDAGFFADMWKSINQYGSWEGEIWNRRKNGETFPGHLNITAVRTPERIVTNYVGTFKDITASKTAAASIEQLAFYDPLTKLPNRRLLQDRLQHALATSTRNNRKGALLLIDLDNFKALNDTMGHDYGDMLLQQVAWRLESCVREGDTVARFGGDEFVVVLEDLSEQAAEAAAQTEVVGEKIMRALNQTYLLPAYDCHSTPSIGATLFIGYQQSGDELLKQADIAMYQAKKDGRNTIRFFDPQMQENVNIRASLEIELRKAIEHKQFHLYYQIQMDDSNRTMGAEVLIRWIHPKRGLIAPEQFIPLAEDNRLILPIGNWVLETVCAQIKSWQQDELTRDLVLAMNVSTMQFRAADFVSQVNIAVRRHAINPRLLKLEITESMLLDNVEETIDTMNALRKIGVQFSLDDFGTGYSSLQYIKRLPLDQIKIDQSFVRDLTSDSNDKAIVRAIIAMAHSLNLGVMAEGVETEEQRQFLLSHGCLHYQGYLFGKPLPIAQFDELLQKKANIRTHTG